MPKFIDNLMKRVERNFIVHDIKYQARMQQYGLLGLNARDTLREFQQGTNDWEAPPDTKSSFIKNAQGMLQQGFNEMFAPSLRQYKALEKAEGMLAESPTGKALLDSSEKGYVLTRLDTQMDAAGVYNPRVRILAINPAAMSLTNAGQSYRGTMTHVLGHEHFHAFQQRTRMNELAGESSYSWDQPGMNFTRNDPRDDILYRMHQEAAAHAVQIQIAHELKDKHPEVLQSLKEHTKLAGVVEAFENAVERDPQALTNGKALRAAHDEWFNPENEVFHEYQGRAIRSWEVGLKRMSMQMQNMPAKEAAAVAAELGSKRIGPEEMTHSGAQPNGLNHMALPGSAAPNDMKYSQAFLDKFEKDLRQIYDSVDSVKQKFSPAAPAVSGPSVNAAVTTPTAPRMSGGKLGL